MHVKVDFSTDCKQHGYDINRPWSYAIYIRKHIWNSWIEKVTYSSLDFCKNEAERLAELPKHYR